MPVSYTHLDVYKRQQMISTAQRYLAIRQIIGDSDRMKEFNDEQKKKLKKMSETSEMELRIAITKGYRLSLIHI